MSPTVQLRPGDPAPWFKAASGSNPNYSFDTVAGRYVLMAFLGSSRTNSSRQALEAVQANRALFDDDKLCFFGVTSDARDRDEGQCRTMIPGIRYFWDIDMAVARLYGATEAEAHGGRGALPLLLAAARPDAAGRGRRARSLRTAATRRG